MKIPKTFIPKKDLEEKTKQLLEESKKRKDETGNIPLFDELKTEFPNFTDYLLNLYSNSNLGFIKTEDKKGNIIWKFYTIPHFIVSKIEPYTEECGKDISEYGYYAKILIEGNWHFLKYRIGFHCFDNVNTIISTKDHLRYDKERSIPFP